MKNLLLLLFAAVFMTSCEKLEDNSPALQGQVDESFFGAIDAVASENDDGSFLIRGLTQDRAINIKVQSPQEGTYQFGGNSFNFGSYKNEEGDVYFSNPFGDGSVTITNWNSTKQTLSGNFNFTALIPGIDTVKVSQGVFFQVPYGVFLPVEEEEVEEPDPVTNAGSFTCLVDGDPYSPFLVSAIKRSNRTITVTGSAANEAITLVMPSDVIPSSNQMDGDLYIGSYREGADTEDALTGLILVTEHDVPNKRIKASYSFETENHSITVGNFNVVYQEF